MPGKAAGESHIGLAPTAVMGKLTPRERRFTSNVRLTRNVVRFAASRSHDSREERRKTVFNVTDVTSSTDFFLDVLIDVEHLVYPFACVSVRRLKIPLFRVNLSATNKMDYVSLRRFRNIVLQRATGINPGARGLTLYDE